MSRPLIAIVGSLDETRTYDPPLSGQDGRAAARELGGELARAQCDLVVFSSSPRFVERDVVSGYAEAADSDARVLVRAPEDQRETFDLPHDRSTLLSYQPSPSAAWEVTFFRSILEADGVVLVGGGRGTRVAGVLAMAREMPLLAVATFGGAARQAWSDLHMQPNDATSDDLGNMGGAWTDRSAQLLVTILLGQRRRMLARARVRVRAEQNARRASALTYGLTAFLLLSAFASVPVLSVVTSPTPSVALVLGGPLLAAMSGALLRGAVAGQLNRLEAAVRGLAAGGVAVLLYVATQLLASGQSPESLHFSRMPFLVIPVGFIAGLTFDQVLAQLRNSDVVHLKSINNAAPGATKTDDS